MKWLIAILMIFPTLLAAQSFNGGLVGGLSACQVDGDALAGYNKPGLIIGGYVSKTLKNNFNLQMEMRYIGKGSRLVPKPQNGLQQRLIRLQYIEVPFLAQYKNNRFYYEAGVAFAALLKSHVEENYGQLPINAMNPAFFKTEYSVNAGFGTQLTERLSGFWRISYSVLPIRDYPQGRSFFYRTGQYNNLMEFIVRYNFGKPKGE